MPEYSQKQLSDAFDLVKNKKDWKNPINAVIPEDKVVVAQAAISYFAYGMFTVSMVGKGKVRIMAPGYYAVEAMIENMFT